MRPISCQGSKGPKVQGFEQEGKKAWTGFAHKFRAGSESVSVSASIPAAALPVFASTQTKLSLALDADTDSDRDPDQSSGNGDFVCKAAWTLEPLDPWTLAMNVIL